MPSSSRCSDVPLEEKRAHFATMTIKMKWMKRKEKKLRGERRVITTKERFSSLSELKWHKCINGDLYEYELITLYYVAFKNG